MSSSDIEVYIKLFNTVGLPIVLLILGLFGVYKIAMFVLPKILALVERYIDDNNRLVEHLSSNSVKTLELLDKLEDSISKLVSRFENKI